MFKAYLHVLPVKLVMLICLLFLSNPTLAQQALEFKSADLQVGQKLYTEHQCQGCHQRKIGGDGNAIYKPAGRINTVGLLRGMVEQCNTELNLQMFPDEVNAIAAWLNQNFYKHKQ